MKTFSTRQAAKALGIHTATLAQYVAVGKVPAPTIVDVGTAKLHVWTEEEIEHVRKLLPKIANGRKTRYQKLRDKQKPPAGVPVPHKKRKTKKKK
jgi:recombinational DNA repair protein RecT